MHVIKFGKKETCWGFFGCYDAIGVLLTTALPDKVMAIHPIIEGGDPNTTVATINIPNECLEQFVRASLEYLGVDELRRIRDEANYLVHINQQP